MESIRDIIERIFNSNRELLIAINKPEGWHIVKDFLDFDVFDTTDKKIAYTLEREIFDQEKTFILKIVGIHEKTSIFGRQKYSGTSVLSAEDECLATYKVKRKFFSNQCKLLDKEGNWLLKISPDNTSFRFIREILYNITFSFSGFPPDNLGIFDDNGRKLGMITYYGEFGNKSPYIGRINFEGNELSLDKKLAIFSWTICMINGRLHHDSPS